MIASAFGGSGRAEEIVRSGFEKPVALSRKVAASLGTETRTLVMVVEGEDDGVSRFLRYLKRSSDPLQGVRYALLELGDPTTIAEKLDKLGATRLNVSREGEPRDWIKKAAEMVAPDQEEKVSVEDGAVRVVYASQTGNAMSIAGDLAEALSSPEDGCPASVKLSSLDGWATTGAFSPGSINVVVASTTGNGDAPDNAEKFWRFVRKRQRDAPEELAGCRYVVLGLGDTNYDKFCHVGKVLDKRLEELGAERLMPIACADEATGLEAVVDQWIQDLWHVLADVGAVKAVPEIVAAASSRDEADLPAVVDPRSVMTDVNELTTIDVRGALKLSPRALDDAFVGKLPRSTTEAIESPATYSAPIVAARLLCDDKDKDSKTPARRVVHVELDLANSGLKYSPGDSIGVRCPNPEAALLTACSCVSRRHSETLNADSREKLRTEVDLSAAPTRQVLRAMAGWCDDEDQRDLCLLLSSRPAGAELYEICISKPRLTVHELMNTLSSCSPSADELHAALPKLAARYYSVASSPLRDANKLAFAFSVVRFYAQQDRLIEGVCTCWLEKLVEPILDERASTNEKIEIFLKTSDSFSLPADPEIPVVMIGPGTGVAPFMGFLDHRQAQRKESAPTAPAPALPGSRPALPGSRPVLPGSRPTLPGSRPQQAAAASKPQGATLYFGCRSPDSDWLYRDEMNAHAASGSLKLRCAFSRQTPGTKVYVQHLMREDSKALADHIKAGGFVYVCGDGSKMAKDVHTALTDVLVKAAIAPNVDAAEAYLQNMKNDNKYLLDIWSPVDEYD